MIWLLRHGEAADGSPDAARPLTENGRRQSRAAGAALATLGLRLDACVTSPRVRADDTARLACEELRLEPRVDQRLAGGGFDPKQLAAEHGDEVMLVGHEPDLSHAVRRLTGARIDLKKGGLAVVDGSALVLLLRPAELTAIAHR